MNNVFVNCLLKFLDLITFGFPLSESLAFTTKLYKLKTNILEFIN